MGGSGDDQPADTMRERAGENRLKLWVLLDANRRVVAAVPVVGVFLALVVLGALDPSPLAAAVGEKDPIETTFQGFLTAIITGVTLVVTLNQLVIAQELGAVGDQRERMDEAMAFRKDVEEAVDVPAAPPEPAAFLQSVVDATSARAADLADAVTGSDDDRFRRRVNALVDGIEDNADAVTNRLADAQFGTFGVLVAALDYNYSWKIYEARRIQNTHSETLSAEADRALDRLVGTLTYFGPAREHFKTLYFRWEVLNLSRAILYAAVPALLVSVAMILFVDDLGTVTGVTLGVENLLWLVSGAVALALVPFMLLLSYILRIATVAKRTLAIGPFILRESDRSDDIDWDE
ncbi:MAG: hypothetical protein ACI9HI_002245 [Salinirussus sp.]|jgi:hypothetical protein